MRILSTIASLILTALWVATSVGAETVLVEGGWSLERRLEAGQSVSIRVGLSDPAAGPPNARLEVRWVAPGAAQPPAYAGDRGDLDASATADVTKTLHALDPDLYVVYRAPAAGAYRLSIRQLEGGRPDAGAFSRDVGLAPLTTPPAPAPRLSAPTQVEVEIEELGDLVGRDILLEAEPNNAPEQAQGIVFEGTDGGEVLRIIGLADELEYFNNARSGAGPDDWFKIVYRGDRPKFLTANLQMAEPTVSARIRVYQPGVPSPEDLKPREPLKRELFGNANPVPYVHPAAEVVPGPTPVYSYWEGRDVNERIHQQDDNFRSFVARRLEPSGVYYLRVEANQPGYELELRVFDPAPFDDPRDAVRQSIYYQLAEVDAWLIHRPRNIAAHRRVRDGTSLFGESCMSCHTQSGVWGVADAFRHGYRPEGTIQNHRRLVNTMYESLRPSIELEDAAVNTSLAPNDLGDAPAGSRVAGRNVVLHERTFQPKKLHAHQQVRTANYILQTADPQGINAAGKGSNFGPNVVFKFAAEILERAWRDTGEEKYFRGLEEKARKILATGDDQLKVVDDLGHRIEFVHELFPPREEYVRTVARLGGSQQEQNEARRLRDDLDQQAAKDLKRILALQQESGGWGFDLGVPADDGWTRIEEAPDAAPTAVVLTALRAAGYGPDDVPVRRAVEWLLADQFPYGLWNRAAQTGFVTNAYVIRALSRLYPADAAEIDRGRLEPDSDETMIEAVSRARLLQTTGRAEFSDLMINATESRWPQVRYYGYLALGGSLAPDGVGSLIDGLDDPVKAVREAAFWSLRQLLLDDRGWDEAFAAYRGGDARTRQSVIQALITRADLQGAKSSVDPKEFARLLADAMKDAHPGVRSFVFKAAWRWWVWNPSMREILNEAWSEHLLEDEPQADAEAALRYSTASILIVNGQIANQTGGKNIGQQYKELTSLFRLLTAKRSEADEERKRLLDRRLTAVAATHFQQRGGDGGPGQLGYSTPGASETIGESILAVYRGGEEEPVPWGKVALQAAANVKHEELERTLLELLREGDLDMAATAARSLSNPQALSSRALPEVLRPLLAKVDRFLDDGRTEDAAALVGFLSKVRWDFDGVSEEQEHAFYRLLAPSSASDAADKARASLLGKILGGNRSLQRRAVFDHVETGSAEFWLPSTLWMAAWEAGGLGDLDAVEGAVEAEDLTVADLTFGRTTEQMVPDGLTSKNTILWWREGVPGAKLTFLLDAPQAGRYEVLSAFLYDREMGTVQLEVNGAKAGEPWDFYQPDLTASGPVSLGVHELQAGENRLTVTMTGANPEAEPNYVFGIDYVALLPDDGSGSIFTKNEQGADVIDPVVAAKDEVVRMFLSWFSVDTPEEIRTQAISLANKTALRRNPEVRKVLAAYVEQEPTAQLKRSIQNILNSDDTVYGEQLRKLIAADEETEKGNDVRAIATSPEWISDILHFRDYVFAELTTINPSDNRACISCHGVPGKVPTLYMDPPDAAGYIAPEKLLAIYRKLQQRVDLVEVEKSHLLVKPLNVQTGDSDGHQGGVRYAPEDPGYGLIRDWVLKQQGMQKGR